MSAPEPSGPPPVAEPTVARVMPHGRFSLIWLIPIVAAALVLYLGYSAVADRGPIVTLVMANAEGLTVDQTEVKHKAVTVGTVTGIKLSPDAKTVLVQVRMVGGSEAMYTDSARFWVVRPRLSAGSLTGIETLVSGAYVEVDPGAPGAKKQLHFTALRQPPGRQSDEPGQVYVLEAKHLGSLGTGSPVYYRDVEVGQVLSYELGAGLGPVTLRVFVREPFDKFVHAETQFWNASGISLTVGAEGMRVVLQSLQTLLSGGIAFATPSNSEEAASPEGASFKLYDDKTAADDAFYQQRIPYVTYFRSSVQGLSSGSPVQISGVRVGSVSDVRLVYDPDARAMVARVAFDLQPQRILSKNGAEQARATGDVVKAFSGGTMRVTLESSNLLTGTRDLSIEYAMGAAGTTVLDAPREGDARVLPSDAGGIDKLTASLADIATKVDKNPVREDRRQRQRHAREHPAPGGQDRRHRDAGPRAAARRDGPDVGRRAQCQRSAGSVRLRAELRVSARSGAYDARDGRHGAELPQPLRLPRSTPRGAAAGSRDPGARALRRSAWIGALALLAAPTACGSSPPSTFYALTPANGAPQPTSVHTLRLRRPAMAGYLDRQAIVQRVVDHRIELVETDRWASPLDEMVGRVLAQDLEQRLPGTTVFTEDGAITADAELTVEVDVRRFDQGGTEGLTLVAAVALEKGGVHAPLEARRIELQQVVPAGATTSTLVAAMSDLLGKLADAVASLLGQLPKAGT